MIGLDEGLNPLNTAAMGKRALAEQTYELEKIVARRMVGRRKEYLVKWLGYPSHQNTWEPLAHLEGVMEVWSGRVSESGGGWGAGLATGGR